MKKRLLSICIILALFLCNVSVFAQTEGFKDVAIDYNRSSGEVNISGSAEFVLKTDEPVRLMVLKPEPEDEDAQKNIDALIAGTVSLKDVCVHLDEAVLSNEKDFVFDSFVLSKSLAPGEYVVRLAAEETEYTAFISVASEEQVVELLNNAEDGNEVEAYVLKYNDVYKLEIDEESEYDSLTEAGKSYVWDKLCLSEYEDAEDIQNSFNTFVQLYRVYMGPWGKMEKIIEDYASLLGINEYSDDYNDLSQSQKDSVYKKISGELYADTDEFAKAFSDAIEEAAKETDESKKPSSGGNGSSGKPSASVVVRDEQKKDEEKNDVLSSDEPFYDLVNHAWAKESILKLYNKGVINGKSSGVFAPNDYVTRAEAVKMIVLAFDLSNENAQCDFNDVAKDSWMYPYIASATENGVIYGYGDGNFGAQAPITREDFATIIVRAAVKAGININEVEEMQIFADAQNISPYAETAVELLQKADVLNGADENMFLPKKSATRAEAAKIIASLI